MVFIQYAIVQLKDFNEICGFTDARRLIKSIIYKEDIDIGKQLFRDTEFLSGQI